MARRLRRFALVLVLVLVVAGVVALALTSRSRLTDDRDLADERWATVRAPLAERYAALTPVLEALGAEDAGDLDVTRDLARELERWEELQEGSDGDVDTEAEVTTANSLEGVAARVNKKVASSPRLSGSEPLGTALGAFAAAVPPQPDVTAYNDAAQSYQDTREQLRYSFAAQVFGYDPLPELFLAPA
jgi:hypothetical protein